MEIEQLRQVIAVAATTNFTRAAEGLGLSQPALSRSIAKLEEELGQPLFERQTRQLALTRAGSLLVERARRILAMVDDTRAEITDNGKTGQVRIGAIPTIAPYFLPSLLARFGREFPEASALVDEDTTDKLLKKLADGSVDVAFLARPLEARYLDVVDLFEEELFLLLSAGHPLVERKQVRLADIEALPFILLGEAHCLTDNIVTFCRQRSFHPMSVERTSQLATVQELVALGHGVSLVPRMARMVDSDPRRVYRSLAGTRPTRTVVMAFNPYRFQSRLLEGFKKLAREHASDA